MSVIFLTVCTGLAECRMFQMLHIWFSGYGPHKFDLCLYFILSKGLFHVCVCMNRTLQQFLSETYLCLQHVNSNEWLLSGCLFKAPQDRITNQSKLNIICSRILWKKVRPLSSLPAFSPISHFASDRLHMAVAAQCGPFGTWACEGRYNTMHISLQTLVDALLVLPGL